jgi:hypothetical protein
MVIDLRAGADAEETEQVRAAPEDAVSTPPPSSAVAAEDLERRSHVMGTAGSLSLRRDAL